MIAVIQRLLPEEEEAIKKINLTGDLSSLLRDRSHCPRQEGSVFSCLETSRLKIEIRLSKASIRRHSMAKGGFFQRGGRQG